MTEPKVTCGDCRQIYTDSITNTIVELCPLHSEAMVDRLAEALKQLVACNERWNADVQQIIGKPPSWTDGYLNDAREVLSDYERRSKP